MEQLLGDQYPAFLSTYGQPRTQGLRANTQKISADELQRRLSGPLEPVPWAPGGLYYPETFRPGRHPYHAAGLYYIQEPSAMAAAAALAPQPGERVLDLCAAPGGKTTHLAALMQDQGLLVANEIHPKRARILLSNLERMGVTSAVVLNEKPDRLAAKLPGFFDRILVDAPCSGEGMFRKLPEASQEWTEDSPAACSLVQREILEAAVAMLRPGGRLLYSTCTFAPAENEEVLLHLLRLHPELTLVDRPAMPGVAPAEPDWTGDPEGSRRLGVERAGRLWPHQLRGEGHFIALLQKEGAPDAPGASEPTGQRELTAKARRPGRDQHDSRVQREPRGLAAGSAKGQDRPLREAVQACERFAQESMHTRFTGPLLLHSEWLYAPPALMPNLDGLHLLRAGLQLGEVRKGRFEPAHALALALRAEDVRQVHDLAANSAEVLAYLRGEALSAAGESGWTLVTVDGFPLGWAKASDGLLKNHYPKGLRWLSAGGVADETEE